MNKLLVILKKEKRRIMARLKGIQNSSNHNFFLQNFEKQLQQEILRTSYTRGEILETKL